MHRLRLIAVTAAAVLLLAACGDEDTTTNANGGRGEIRTVEVDMVDIAFEPDTIEVARGETIRFLFTNRGEVAHDAFIGDRAAQATHEAEMRERDDDAHDSGHGDDDADAVTVEPGDSAELTYTFDESETVEIGCHQPGHYDAGMKITAEVT